MENIVFERNYEKPKDGSDHCTAIFDQAVEGGFFQRYCDMMNKVPKIIVPQDKENYEYLLNRCNQYAEQHYGRIRGVVSYERWDSTIDLYLTMLEFDDEEDMSLLRDIGEKAHYVNVSHQPDGGFCLHIMINYFEELASDMEKDYIQYAAIEQDEKLASMFQMPELPPEANEVCQHIKELLDRFDDETSVDRTSAFKAVLAYMSKKDDEYQSFEYMAAALEMLLNKILEEENGEEQL